MQGLHPGHATVRGNAYRGYRHSLTEEDVTVAMLLKQAGYRTGLFGKWGLALSHQPGVPTAKGFDEFFGYLNQRKAHSFYPHYLWHNTTKIPLPQNAGHTAPYQAPHDYTSEGKLILHNVADPDSAVYSFDLIAGKSHDFIRRNKDRPFFLYLAHTLPHGPLIVPDLHPYTNEDWPTIRHKEWAAMVTRLDTEVGRVVGLIDSLGLSDNTLIIFCSDNGYSAHGYFRGVSGPDLGDFFKNYGPTRGRKGDIYDGGLRVPAIAYWPGTIAAGTVNDHIWAFWDFLPTAAELAGVKLQTPRDGISIVPTLTGRDASQIEHEYLYWEFKRAQALRMGRWYAHKANLKAVELYDVEKDPAQANDLASQYPDLVSRIENIFRKKPAYRRS
jgi:arylsulfatase A-like enzyme